MSTNISQFNTELDKASDKIHGDFKKFHRQVCLEVLTRIVYRTPVDEGRARGNWQVEFGNPTSGVLEVSGSEDAMADLSISKGITKLSDIPQFSLVHITNNVEYIFYLEYVRTSPQHAEGMVEITLTELATWLSEIK